MLVRAFQIQIGARALIMPHGVRATHHVPVGCPGVKPDIQRIAGLLVQRRLVTQQLGSIQIEPGIDALLLDPLRNLLDQLNGTRVQLARLAMQEERDRHTPVTLTGDTPVRTTGNHVVQALLAPGRNKLGFFNGLEGAFTQRGTAIDRYVHAHKPLCGGAVDQRRLVAPAVHVAVLDAVVLEQCTDFFQLGNNGRIGLPDELATKERQVRHVHAIALYRAENVVIAHAVLLAGTEVVFTVGRRRVNDASAGVQFNILGQINRREALVQRVTETDQLKRCTFSGCQHLPLKPVALQTALDQIFGQHQQALAGIDQRVAEFRVDVQRLVGRDGPGGSGPDDDRGGLAQRRQTKSGGELVGIFRHKGNINGL